MKLNVKAFALTGGLLWGVGLLGMTWWLIMLEGASDEPIWISRFYLGYRVTPLGSLIGLLWALPDGLIGGALFAWVYNRFATIRTAVAE
ncbi:MAG: bacteriophage holin [Planctomycetes bacterium]|nr:bacteriophage holin [Planctomycetota bacterium]